MDKYKIEYDRLYKRFKDSGGSDIQIIKDFVYSHTNKYIKEFMDRNNIILIGTSYSKKNMAKSIIQHMKQRYLITREVIFTRKSKLSGTDLSLIKNILK